LMTHKSAEFSYNVSRGEQESYLLSQLVNLTDLEPKANNCTEVISRTDHCRGMISFHQHV